LSTAFSDTYKPLFRKGSHVIKTQFTELRDVIDIHKSGLRVFIYCADPLSMLSSTIMTTLLWIGGSGSSKYLPMIGSKPTNYQIDNNIALMESVGARMFEKRIIDHVYLSPRLMKTGDVLIARRFTGHASETMMLSGGYANHAAMIMRDADDQAVYVIDCLHDKWIDGGKVGV
jgi:hypothetical protein